MTLGQTAEDCTTVHHSISLLEADVARWKETKRQAQADWQMLPAEEQGGPGTIGYSYSATVAAMDANLSSAEGSMRRLCERADELGCPCRDWRRLAILGGAGLVALVGVVWLVRR
jgi:hypothetical protein